MTNKERCAIKADDEIVKNANLGEFVEGYTSSKDKTNWKFLLWLLLPFLGWIVVFMLLTIMFFKWMFASRHTVVIYKQGFLWKTYYLLYKGDEQIVKFADMDGLLISKTKCYQSYYGLFEHYTNTNAYFSIINRNNEETFAKSFSYSNEDEDDDSYNAAGFAAVAISKAWNDMALEKINKELTEKGACKFYVRSGNGFFTKVTLSEVEIGRGFIKYEGHYAGDNLRYSFSNGLLLIYPSEEDNHFAKEEKYFAIDVNNMYDKHIFLLAASQLIGIK